MVSHRYIYFRIFYQQAPKFHYSTAAPLTGKEPSSWSRPRCFVFPALMQSHHSLSSALLLLLKVAPHLLANSPEMFWGGFEIWLMSWPWTIPCWIVWDIRPSALQGHLSWYPHEGHANASSRTQTLVGRLCWGKDIYQNKIHIPHLLLCVSSHKYVVFRWFLFKEEGDPNPGFLHEVLLDWQPQLSLKYSNTQIPGSSSPGSKAPALDRELYPLLAARRTQPTQERINVGQCFCVGRF